METDRSKWTEQDWQKGRNETAVLNERMHGPIVGRFTINEVAKNGDHPAEVRAAWKGVPLPVRKRFVDRSEEVVMILISDGYNALVEAETPEAVLQYWIELFDGKDDGWTTFNFQPEDGDYFIVDPPEVVQAE